jgi:hypothetical protein
MKVSVKRNLNRIEEAVRDTAIRAFGIALVMEFKIPLHFLIQTSCISANGQLATILQYYYPSSSSG